MFSDVLNLFTFALPFEHVLLNLAAAFICGLGVSMLYRAVYNGPSYSANFIRSMVVLPMITALVIMVIGNNLARAFGLVGAMSIIRFRTAVKDTQDIVFIFFSLAVGMASGVGLRSTAMVGTVLIGGAAFFLNAVRFANPNRRSFIIQFVCRIGEHPPYVPLFKKYGKKFILVNMVSVDEENFDLSFHAELKKKEQISELSKELGKLPDVSNVRLFFDDAER